MIHKPNYLFKIHEDIVEYIFSYLWIDDLVHLNKTCHRYHNKSLIVGNSMFVRLYARCLLILLKYSIGHVA